MKHLLLLLFLTVFTILAGCSPQQQAAVVTGANAAQTKIAALCGTAMQLAPVAGPYAVWITGACGSEAVIAQIALNPTTEAWLQDIINKVRAGPAAHP